MLAEKSTCIGCSACAAVCPTKAIDMQRDNSGFLYPAVIPERCISCGKCTRACPILTPAAVPSSHNLDVYSGHFSSADKTLQSASGGFVSALSESVIHSSGVVYGVCYNEDFSRAVYCRADTLASLEAMKGSKYIMSEIAPEIYSKLENDLKAKKNVLFIGCPCEVYAVKNYFKEKYENLLTCELICQGGTSPRALRLFVRDLEEQYHSKVKNLNMRAKRDNSAVPYMMRVEMESGDTFFEPLETTDFDAVFHHVKRECCYNCRFKMPHDVADFTAGDHIGMSEGDKGFFKSGVSIIFVHTPKAEQWMKRLNSFVLDKETFSRGAGIQTCLFHSIEKSLFYEKLVDDLHHDKLKGAAQEIHKMKCSILSGTIKDAKEKLGNKPQKLLIWGVGKYFRITWDTVKTYFPDSSVIGIVDKYKTGERCGVPIIRPEAISDLDFNHVFINSVGAQKEALDLLTDLFGKDNCKHYYTLVMLPSDLKHDIAEEE